MARVTGSHAEQQFGSSASARTLAYGGSLTVGNLLVVTVTTFIAGITVTVSDGTNGNYTQAGAYAVTTDTLGRVSIWYFQNNASSGTPTVTVTPSASAFISISQDEYSGIATTGALRSVATGTTGSSTSIATGTITATAGDLVVAVATQVTSGATASSVSSPFALITNLGSAVNEGIYTASDVNAPSNEACTFTMTGIVMWAALGASFVPVATSTGGGPLINNGELINGGPLVKGRLINFPVYSPENLLIPNRHAA